jgi:hypothetical protein
MKDVNDFEEVKTTINRGTLRVILRANGVVMLEVDTPPNARCSCDGAWLELTPAEASSFAVALLEAAHAAQVNALKIAGGNDGFQTPVNEGRESQKGPLSR